MTFSSLISGTIPNHGKYSHRSAPISRVIQHHHAGLGGGTERLTDPNAPASVTYNILTDGSIWGQVPEEFQPWTSGSDAADDNAITFEIQNSGGRVNGNDDDPESWRISAAALNSAIRLLADIAQRRHFGAVNSTTYRGHREFFSTACPGGFLWSRMDLIRASAQALLIGSPLTQGTINPNSSEDIDMATGDQILARLTEQIGWQDQKFNELKAQMDSDRNALASWVRDLFNSGDNVSEAELDAKLASAFASSTANSGVRLYKGKDSPDIYVWDGATGFRHIFGPEYTTLTLGGAVLVEPDQEVMDLLLGVAK